MRLAARRALLPGLIAGALLLGGCEDDTSSNEASEYALGVPVWQASCAEWERADPQARAAALDEMKSVRRQQLSGRNVGRGYGSVLKDDVAYRLFDDRCELPNSDGFLLYRLYGFAAGFAGEAPER